jgi:tape measure domain-containing protein
VAQANVKLTVDASQATRALKGVQAQSTGLQNNLGRLKAAFAGVAFTAVAKQAVSTASNFQALQLRMKVLTSEFGEFAQAQELVAKAQDKFNLSITEATKGVTDIFARLRPLGISMKDIETTFLGFNTIAKLAGLNATEASAAFTQLAQGLGSGRLQGDEFRSIAEQVPQLLTAISKETGIAEGKLKDFASKGLLKSDIILRALNRSLEEGEDKIGDIMAASPAEVFKKFSNATEELQMTLGAKLLPIVLQVTKATTALIEGIVSFVDSEAGQVTFTFLGIAAAIKGISIIAPLVVGQVIQMAASFQAAAIQSALASTGLTGLAAKSFLVAGGVTKATIAVNAFKIALAKTGVGLAVIAFGLLATEILKVINAQKEFNRVIEEGSKADVKQQMLDQIETIQKLEEKIANANPVINLLSEQFNGLTPTVASMSAELENAKKKLEQLENRFAEADAEALAKEFASAVKSLQDTNKALERNNEVEKELSEEAKIQTEFKQAITDLEEKYTGDQLKELMDLQIINRDLQLKGLIIKDNTEKAKKLNDAFKQIGQDIGTGITDALASAVEGTRSLGEAARSILNDIASSLLRLGINAALTGLFGGTKIGGFLGFANGGRPPVGKASIVGERGPEIFVPRTAGTIIPNNQIGGGGDITNITVNVDANESSVEGDTGQSQALGRQLATAIQTELIKQKRPGGLLA